MKKTIWHIQRNRLWDHYSLTRFRQRAKELNLGFQVLQPDQFTLGLGLDDSLLIDGQQPKHPPSLVLPRMGANTPDWAVQVLRRLQTLGWPVVNQVDPILLARDKFQSLLVLEQAGLPVPKTLAGRTTDDYRAYEDKMGYPLVLKTLVGLQGKNVFLCRNSDELRDLVQFIHSLAPQTLFLVQKYIAESQGRDLRVFTIKDKAVGAMERRSSPGDFKANLARGGKPTRYPLSKELEQLAVQSAQALGLDYAGVDFLFGNGRFLLCEVNSSPGFEGFEAVTGLNIPDLLYKAFLK